MGNFKIFNEEYLDLQVIELEALYHAFRTFSEVDTNAYNLIVGGNNLTEKEYKLIEKQLLLGMDCVHAFDNFSVIIIGKTIRVISNSRIFRLRNTKFYKFAFSAFQTEYNNISFYNFDISGISELSGLFKGCVIHRLDFSGIIMSWVDTINSMFKDATIDEIDFTNFSTKGAKSMYAVFDHCKTGKLDLRNFDTSSVEDMSYMFFCCEATEIILSSFDTRRVKEMTNMFALLKVDKLIVGNFDTSRVEIFNFMFERSHIKSTNLNKLSFKNKKQGDGIFSGCSVTLIYADGGDECEFKFGENIIVNMRIAVE